MATYPVEGMHCGACVKRIESALMSLPDVQAGKGTVRVTLNPPAATIEGAEPVRAAVEAALSSAGNYRIASAVSGTTPSAATGAVSVPLSAIPVRRAGMPATPTSIAAPVVDHADAHDEAHSWISTYRPLLTIVGFIVIVTVLSQHQAIASGTFDGETWMRHFMAGFFIVFAFFKLLDVRAFADAYAGYDLLAARWPAWGKLYPFVELGLGIAYLVNFAPAWTNAVTLAVMGFSAIGVIRAVLRKQQIRCACLGAVFNLPMSTVTIVEDVAMAAMAGWMLMRL